MLFHKIVSTRQAKAILISTAALTFLMPARRSDGADYKAIVDAINRGVEYLKSQQKNGHWELVPKAIAGDDFDARAGQFTGRTALATWTLLMSGVDKTDPVVASGVKFLEEAKTHGIYALGVRSQVWGMLGNDPAAKAAMEKDADLLLNGSKTYNEMSTGFYGYLPTEAAKENYDHSVSQFGVLGMWSAQEAGLRIPRQYWQMTAVAWMSHQYLNGGWTYKYAADAQSASTMSMTAAGLATLLIVQDELVDQGNHGMVDLTGIDSFGSKEVSGFTRKRLQNLWQSKNSTDPVSVAVETGIKWMGDNFELFHGDKDVFYTLFGVSRVGAASGRKFLGQVNWYEHGCDFILRQQQPDGSFNGGGDGDDGIPDTCLALLFLERGLAPVMINKLQYTRVDKAGKPAADGAHWNNRPRDASNLAKWFGHSTEKFFNWQLVSLDNGPDELHDAPILYLAGDQSLKFSPDDEQKLKEFVEQGGLILGNADEGREPFSTSFKTLGSHLFHQYEFRPLPANHPIYTSEQFLRTKWHAKPEVLGLGNGIRELMLLIPHSDPSKAWQASTVTDHPELHQLAANIYLYMTDKNSLRFRLPSFIARADSHITGGKPISLAQLSYAGNWNPEPGGWRRVAALAHNEDQIDLSIDPVKIAETTASIATEVNKPGGKLAESLMKPDDDKTAAETMPEKLLTHQPLAHLTGSVSFSLSNAQRDAIRKYVAGGGTLFVDAAGGSSAFKISADAELAAIFGADAAQLHAPLELNKLPDSPLAKELASLKTLSFRQGTETIIGHGSNLRLRGIVLDNRLAVIYSPEDISEGMVGEPVDGVIGYAPQTATDIARAILRGIAAKQ